MNTENNLGGFNIQEEIAKENAKVLLQQDIDKTLADRGKRYGKFVDHAYITQQLKDEMRATKNWIKLSNSQREALEMIAHKIGRILNGNPNFHDSWHDIVGYAKLVADELLGKEI